MRIGFDAKRFFLNRTGLGNYSRDLIRILETFDKANEHVLYTPKIKDTSFISFKFSSAIRQPQNVLAKFFSSIWRSKWVVNDLLKDKIAVYHGLSGEIPTGLHRAKIKSVVTIHDLIFLKFPELYKPLDRFLYDRKFKYAVNNADKIVAISEQTKRDIVSFYGVPEEEVEVIYQGCHPAFKVSKTEEEKEKLREKYKLPNRFILNVGSIEPRKNAFQIVKAIENLDIPLLIIGKQTAYSREILKYIEQKGLQSKVKILQGFTMDELATIYSMATIFVYPSVYEGFGIPIIEALYSGTPVITNKFGVFPEAGGPSSCYIDPEDVEELSTAISSILSDEQKRQEMKETGLAYVQRFNDEALAKQWIELYASI